MPENPQYITLQILEDILRKSLKSQAERAPIRRPSPCHVTQEKSETKRGAGKHSVGRNPSNEKYFAQKRKTWEINSLCRGEVVIPIHRN